MAENLQVRIPPHSSEAEESVLGALLLDKDAIIAVAEFLRPEDFYEDKHKEIFASCLELYEERIPIDVLTVSDRLKRKKVLKQIGGASYLAELANRVPTAAHVEHYGKIVKDAATKRLLMAAASKLVGLSMDESLPANELLDKAEAEVFSLTQKHLSQTFSPVKDALAESFDRLDELHKQAEGLRGVPTGFKDLDDTLAGLQKSNLLILAARPGVGKTSLALNIAQNITVGYQRPVAIFSLEMSKEELVDRLLVAQADIDAWKLKTGRLSEEDFTALSNAMGVLAEAPLYIDDTPALSILEMRTKARRLQVEVGIDLIIVDYLQLARSRRLENRVQEVSEISQGLKNLARELKLPILAISQLSRAVEQRGEKRPQLADLRESGCLSGETLLVLADSGKRVRMDSLLGKGNIKLLTVNEKLKIEQVNVKRIFSSGRKVVYRLLLKSGREIMASANHRFMKVNGWERVDGLKIKDKIATTRILPLPARNKRMPVKRLILLAHLIGDGCFLKHQPLHYTNSDIALINCVRSAAVSEFGIKPRVVKQKNWYHLYLSAKEHLAHNKRNPIVKWLDEELGIFDRRSREKRIPDAVFALSKKEIALFLKHLFSTDGCVYLYEGIQKRKVTLYYASGSKGLVNDVFHLLLRLGILSTITRSKKKGCQDIYNVQIYGKINQLNYLKNVGFVGSKTKIANQATKFLKTIDDNPNNDVVPREIWKYINQLRIKKEISSRQMHGYLKWKYSGTSRYRNSIGRDRLNFINSLFKDKRLNDLANSDLYWDEIKNIKKIGTQEVYDISVPKYHNFIANDIVVHNSIEQDADVVMFLWREDEENMENIILDVAKHRNGPLKSVKLFFRGDRIKFYGRETKRSD